MRTLPLRLFIPPGTPFLDRVRIAWAVTRFAVMFNRATEADQDWMIAWLNAQPGVTAKRTDEG